MCIMVNHDTMRFDAAYAALQDQGAAKVPLIVDTQDNPDGLGYTVSVAIAEGFHIDPSKRQTSRAIGYLMTNRVRDPATMTAGVVGLRVNLFRDAEGGVLASYSDYSTVMNELSRGLNHGYPETERQVPEISEAVALESALVAVEQILPVND